MFVCRVNIINGGSKSVFCVFLLQFIDSVDDEETDDVDSSNHDIVPTPVRSVPSDVTDVAQIQVDRGGGRRNPKVPSIVQNKYILRSRF